MKHVKAHLFLIICGIVAIVALAVWYFPIGGVREKTIEEAQKRHAQVKAINEFNNFTINIPGMEPLKGPPIPKITAERRKAMEEMKDKANRIAVEFAKGNRINRVTVQGDKVIPMLGDKAMPHHLPAVDATQVDPYNYKSEYERYLLRLALSLSGIVPPNNELGTLQAAAKMAVPPTAEEINAAIEAEKRAYSLRPEAKEWKDTNLPPERMTEIATRMISDRAVASRMYVAPAALQRRGFLANPLAKPSNPQVFESFVDCWLMTDIVRAINGVNADAFASRANPKAGEKHAVAHSAIKRLDRIVVGGSGAAAAAAAADASGTPSAGGLFLAAVRSGPTPGNPQMGAVAAGGIDHTRSMTGRTGEDKYDVVLVRVQMVIDPSAINKFIDQLYQQNNAYTVLNVQMQAVDPFEALANGYLFGDTQCVRVEILVEALLFREWTTPIMPAEYRALLGIAPAGPAVAQQ